MALVFGVFTFVFSNSSSPKDRASEAAGAALAGGAMAGGCLFQCLMAVLPIVIGLLVIR